jgi:Actin like proteins N terminal domain
MNTHFPLYYAGFEVGSAFSGLKVIPADGLALAQDLATLPSFLADGDITTLLKGSALETTLADALQGDDYVLTWQDRTYFLGNLLEHGTHSHNAFNDERRYWSLHAQVLLLCLACILIPERCFEVRLVTALPVTLYDRVRRQQVKQGLSQHYCFSFNGRAREVKVTCGYVAMEGQGILIHCGDAGSEQAIIDVGERTTDLVAANGQRLVGRFCKGEQFGIGQLVADVQQLGQRYRRKFSVEKAHALLTAYAHQHPYPPIAIGTGLLPEQEITEVIKGSIERLAQPLTSFLVGAWNIEGAPAGTQFDTIYLGGGGAYYVEKVIREALEDCHLVTVPDPEYANICGYAELAASLDEERWEGM